MSPPLNTPLTVFISLAAWRFICLLNAWFVSRESLGRRAFICTLAVHSCVRYGRVVCTIIIIILLTVLTLRTPCCKTYSISFAIKLSGVDNIGGCRTRSPRPRLYGSRTLESRLICSSYWIRVSTFTGSTIAGVKLETTRASRMWQDRGGQGISS